MLARVARRNLQIQLTPRRVPGQGRSQALVDSLLEATKTILLRDGFERAGTAEIARLAGASVGSLYQYFPNLESLAAALYVRTEERALDYVAENLLEASEMPLEEACYLIVLATTALYVEDRALWCVLLETLPRIGAERKRAEVEHKWHELFRSMLTARAEHVRPQHRELAAFLMRRVLASALEVAVRERPELLEDDAFKDELTELLFAYLRV
jgi:AcrR family transcriptional regulator